MKTESFFCLYLINWWSHNREIWDKLTQFDHSFRGSRNLVSFKLSQTFRHSQLTLNMEPWNVCSIFFLTNYLLCFFRSWTIWRARYELHLHFQTEEETCWKSKVHSFKKTRTQTSRVNLRSYCSQTWEKIRIRRTSNEYRPCTIPSLGIN